jgi:hypothetical protein
MAFISFFTDNEFEGKKFVALQIVLYQGSMIIYHIINYHLGWVTEGPMPKNPYGHVLGGTLHFTLTIWTILWFRNRKNNTKFKQE